MVGGDLDFAKGDSHIGCLNGRLVGDHLKNRKLVYNNMFSEGGFQNNFNILPLTRTLH